LVLIVDRNEQSCPILSSNLIKSLFFTITYKITHTITQTNLVVFLYSVTRNHNQTMKVKLVTQH